MNKRIKIIAGIVVLGLAAFFVKRVFFPPSFLYNGTIEATKVDLSSRVASVVSKRLFHEGDHVKQGQLLMVLSCRDYKLAASIADENDARAQKLYHQGSLSKQSFDQIENAKDMADLRASWCQISSPITGTVLTKYHEAGELVAPDTKLVTLANLQDVYAYIYVAQPLVASLRIGEKLIGYLPELHMKPFTGHITHINEEAEFTPKNVQTVKERTRLVYGVKVSFSNPDEILKPGMSIEVQLPHLQR